MGCISSKDHKTTKINKEATIIDGEQMPDDYVDPKQKILEEQKKKARTANTFKKIYSSKNNSNRTTTSHRVQAVTRNERSSNNEEKSESTSRYRPPDTSRNDNGFGNGGFSYDDGGFADRYGSR